MAFNSTERPAFTSPPKKSEHSFFSGIHSIPAYHQSEKPEHRSPRPIYASFDLSKPDSIEGLNQLLNEWGDKDSCWVLKSGDRVPLHQLTDSSPQEELQQIARKEVHLFSHGKRKAIASYTPAGKTYFSVIADENKLPTNQDEDMNFFNDLMLNYRAWAAGNLVRSEHTSTDVSTELKLPYLVEADLVPAGDD